MLTTITKHDQQQHLAKSPRNIPQNQLTITTHTQKDWHCCSWFANTCLKQSCSFLLFQDWTFEEAFYFCFVSLATVGFGGLRPSEPHLWSCAIYIFFAAAILSTVVHILYEDVVCRLSRYRAHKAHQRLLLESSDESLNCSAKSSVAEIVQQKSWQAKCGRGKKNLK